MVDRGNGETVPGQSPDVRVAARQDSSAAFVADLYKLWQDTLPRISGKSKLADAIRYALVGVKLSNTSATTGASK